MQFKWNYKMFKYNPWIIINNKKNYNYHKKMKNKIIMNYRYNNYKIKLIY